MKKQTLKKLLSGALALAMLAPAAGTAFTAGITVNAAASVGVDLSEFSGQGTQADPYLISSSDDWNRLCDMNSTEGVYFKLTNNITVTKTCFNSFGGVFDGDGHTITVDCCDDGSALFYYTFGAVIKNTVFSGKLESSDVYTAGVVNMSNGGTVISNCINNMTVCGTGSGNSFCGGYAGIAYSGGLSIVNSKFSGSLVGAEDTYGWSGFIGYPLQSSTSVVSVENCYMAPEFISVPVKTMNKEFCGNYAENAGIVITNSFYSSKTAELVTTLTQGTSDENGLDSLNSTEYWENGTPQMPQAVITQNPDSRILDYTGTLQTLCTPAEASGGTVYYKVNDGSWSTSLPTASSPGQYKITCKVVGDNNHRDSEEKYIYSRIIDASVVDYAIPQNVEVTVDSLPTGEDESSLISGDGVLTIGWDENSAVDTCEIGLKLTLASTGETKWIYEGETVCAPSDNVPEEYSWTTNDGRNSYSIIVPVLGEDDAQEVDGNYVNGAKEGDTIHVYMTALAEYDGDWYETNPSDTVSFPAALTSADVTFPKKEENTKPDLGWAVPGNVKVYKDTLPLTSDGQTIVPGTTQDYVSWSNDDDVTLYEIIAKVTSPSGESGILVYDSASEGMYSTDSNGRNFYSMQYEVVAAEDQEFSDGWVNGAVAGDQIEVTVVSVVEYDGEYYTSDPSEGVSYTLATDCLGQTYPLVIVPTAPESAIPKNFKATPLTMTLDENDVVTTGKMTTALTWDNNDDVDEGEVYVMVTTPEGEEAWLYEGYTICRASGDVPGSVAWSTSDGTNTYVLTTPTVAAEDQKIHDGYANAAKEGDTLTIYSTGLVYEDGWWLESDPSNSVSFTVTKSSLDVTYPVAPAAPGAPENFEVTPVAMILDEDGIVDSGKMAVGLSWDDNEQINEGAVFAQVTTAEDETYWIYGYQPLTVLREGYGPNVYSWATSEGTNSYTMTVPTVASDKQEISNGYINGAKEGDTLSIYYCGLYEDSNGRYRATDPTETVSFKVTKSSLDVTYPLPIEGLTNDSELETDVIVLGNKLTVNCAASGGNPPYMFEVFYKRSSSSNYTKVQDYSLNNTVKIKPASATTYDILVNAKDQNGTVAEKILTVTVNKPLENTTTLASASAVPGGKIVVNSSAQYGMPEYQFAVYCRLKGSGSWKTVQAYSNNETTEIAFEEAGEYEICSKAKDESGTISKLYFDVSVKEPLSNTSTVSSEAITLGETITVNCSSKGGTGDVQYSVHFKKSTSSKWIIAQNYSSNDKVTLTPDSEGTYNICIKAKDSSGEVAKVYFDIDVSVKEPLTNTSTVSSEAITLGEAVTVNCSSKGGTGDVQFSVHFKTASSKWTVAQSYSSNDKVTLTPESEGTYNICIKAKDSSGEVAKIYIDVSVNAPLTNTSTVSSETVKAGETLTVNCSSKGGTGDVQYSVHFKTASSKWTVAQNYSSTDKVTLTLNSESTYNICVKAKDSSGTIVKLYFDVTAISAE